MGSSPRPPGPRVRLVAVLLSPALTAVSASACSVHHGGSPARPAQRPPRPAPDHRAVGFRLVGTVASAPLRDRQRAAATRSARCYLGSGREAARRDGVGSPRPSRPPAQARRRVLITVLTAVSASAVSSPPRSGSPARPASRPPGQRRIIDAVGFRLVGHRRRQRACVIASVLPATKVGAL